MQATITLMTVMGGMFFSLCLAVLLEELLFGCLFRLFFSTQGASTAGRATAGQPTQQAKTEPLGDPAA
jgi:hypothetical protein